MVADKSISMQQKWGKGRYVLVISILLIVVVFVSTVSIFENNLESSVLTPAESSLKKTASRLENQVQQKLTHYRNDLRFLFSTPPISGLTRAKNNAGIDPIDNTSFEQWVKRLETIFAAFIQNNAEYEQLRIISADQTGMELIRVERNGDTVRTVTDRELQNKSDRDYNIPGTKLSEGELYMSGISVNREFGEIRFPIKPMLRLSLPIFDSHLNRFGFLILSINAEHMLKTLADELDINECLVITDSDGYFLVHPDPKLMYSRDLAPTKKWQTLYKTSAFKSTELKLLASLQSDHLHAYYLTKKIVMTDEVSSGLYAHILLPVSYVNEAIAASRTDVYSFLSVVSFVLFIILAFVYYNLRRGHELADARAHSQAIIGGSKDAIISLSKAGVVYSWNYAAEKLFAIKKDNALGKVISELALFPDINLQQEVAGFSDESQKHTLEASIERQGEGKRHLLVYLSPIVSDSHEVNGVALIIRDITAEKLVKDEIRQANIKLEEKVAQRTAQLQKASEIKSTFISNVSHEMRTPLNGIVGTLHLLKKDPLNTQQLRYLEMTEVSVDALTMLINDVLDLSKIEAGKLEMDFKAFDPVRLIENLCSAMAVKAQQKGLEFILDLIDLNCSSMVSDPHRLTQILTNLINNAIKFTPSGHIQLKAYSEVNETQDVIFHFEVSDSGVGIAKENQSKLFSAFSQETRATASKYGGTGLGLSICKQLSALLGGSISFDSDRDKGSTFHLQIHCCHNDVTLIERKNRLAGRSVAIFVNEEHLHHSLIRLVEGLGGDLLPTQPFENWLLAEKGSSKSLPDIVILNQQDKSLQLMDRQWGGKHPLPEKVIVLANNGEEQTQANYIRPIQIFKPVLLSDLLGKSCCMRSQASPAQIVGRRKTDFSEIPQCNFSGATVLVVDDNDINIEVAIGVLSVLSVNFESASDGRQAIEKLIQAQRAGRSIHCILMDCNMPVLDGCETTNLIRAGEAGECFKTIPIVAMTASVMTGEKNKCLESGMNDYIVKPIVAEDLISKVSKWLMSVDTQPEKAKLSFAEKGRECAVEYALKNTEGWDKKLVLQRLMNNHSLLIKMCQLFIGNTPKSMEALREAINDNDFDKIRQISHALKGGAGQVGATRLYEHLARLEIQAQTQSVQEIEECINAIEISYQALMAGLKQELLTA